MSEPSLTFAAVGDVSLGDHPLCVGFGSHSKFKKLTADFPFARVQEEFNKYDLLFGNLECTLSEINKKSGDYHSIQMRGQENYINGLVNAGFDVMNMANNHALQHGEQPFKATVDILNSHNIKPCGVNYDNHLTGKPVIINKNEIDIAFLGYSLRPRQYFEQPPIYTEGLNDGIINDINNIKRKVNHVIVSLHWGEEFIQTPSPEEVLLARNIIDNGASLVIGHHPHVLRGIEKYKQGYIAYSLGNFVCDMVWDNSLRETGILNCKLTHDSISNMELTPAYINNQFQPEILHGKAAESLLKKFEILSREVEAVELSNVETQKDDYLKKADDVLRIIRKKSQLFFLKRIWKYPPLILAQQLLRYFTNRLHELRTSS